MGTGLGYNDPVRRALTMLERDPLRALTFVAVAAAAIWVLVYPFSVVTYPPITDLPFHAAQVSIIRHYGDPAYHFQEQFTLHPLSVPYITMYGIGALAALVFPITVAAKVMTACMLALLPLGLGVLFHGMKKNPLLGLVGLGFAWTDLTHWGFLSFVGALGLYAAAIGCTLLVLDAPTRKRQLALFATLVVLFFTHVARMPYALLAIALTAAVMYPATQRVKPLLAPLAAPTLLFVVWFALRPRVLAASLGAISFDASRAARFGQFLFGSYVGAKGAEERMIAWMMLAALAALVVLALAFREPTTKSDRRFRVGVTALPLLLASGHLLAYFTLPARIGEWWYVYPRELVAAAYIGVAAIPDLPRKRWLELGAVALITLATGRMASFVGRRFAGFERETADFRAVTSRLPRAPRLAYLVVDHFGAKDGVGDKRNSAYVHLPAWVQATKGGWLSFHFAGWGLFPVQYRSGAPGLPPPVPRDWEWNPLWFRVLDQGRSFDWFLVRLADDPGGVFTPDPTIHLVDHQGTWWLYRRD